MDVQVIFKRRQVRREKAINELFYFILLLRIFFWLYFFFSFVWHTTAERFIRNDRNRYERACHTHTRHGELKMR